MPPKPCNVHICPKYAVNKGFCDDHQDRIKKHSWDHKGKNRHQRGYGSDWEKIRAKVLARDKYLCQECLKNGYHTYGNQGDHIIPKAKGGTDHLDNLQCLCYNHHKQKTIEERKQ